MKAILAAALMLGAGALMSVELDESLAPGLVGEYFSIGEELSEFPDPGERKPAIKKIDLTINAESTEEGFNGTALTDHFFVRWTGVLKIPGDGKYRFYTESDDGSRLFIDGRQIVDNGGLHAMEEKSGEVELGAGEHDIRIELFENIGSAGCRVFWETDGSAKQIIPASALRHRKGSEK